MQRAIEIDPIYLAPRMDLTYALLQFRHFEKASREFAALWDKGFRSPECWVGNFVASVMAEDVDSARSWLDAGPMGDTDKQMLGRFIDAHIGGVDDPELVDDIFNTPGVRLDYRMLIWMLAELEDYETTFRYIDSRLERGLNIDPRPLWNPGIEIGIQAPFPDLLNRLGLIDYWETVGWGDVCRPENGTVLCDARNLTPDRIDEIMGIDSLQEDLR